MRTIFLCVFALLSASVVTGCMREHTNTQALAKTDCYTCHRPEYEATPGAAAADPAIPDHIAMSTVYTTACADCHNTQTWFSHPEKLFNVQSGPHAQIECNACHVDSTNNSGDAHGSNTLCTNCHFASEAIGKGTMALGHSDQPAFSYSSPPPGYTTTNFCLSCHPDGRERPHPDAAFPQGHGNANGCNSCHDRSKGSDAMGQNADCRQCHSNGQLAGVGDHPGDVTTMPSPSGCLRSGCHYGGRGGGN